MSKKNSYCSSTRSLCNDEDCEICFNKSFASNEKSQFFSKRNILLPRDIHKSSGKKYWFDCPDCKHEFEILLHNITNHNNFCKYCANQALCNDVDCNICFNKSFASHEKALFWSSNNETIPRNIFKGTKKKYWFKCNECEHEFEKSICDITGKNGWCGYCGNKQLCDNKKCDWCFNNSFASFPRSKFWSDENELSPRQITKYSNKKFEFICENNHKFISALYSISDGKWCSLCKNKTEEKLYNWLKETYTNIETQVKFDWCKNIKHLPFDFLLKDLKIIIELDGEQHFKQVGKWHPPEVTQKTDFYKMTQAIKNGYSIVRIYQPDVFNDTIDWKDDIKEHIECQEVSDIALIASNLSIYDDYLEYIYPKNKKIE